jgi:hypothetical protein
MKEILNELALTGLSTKHKVFVWYFVVSFCLIGSVAEAPVWLLVALVANFANAARLIRKVPLPKNVKDTEI